MRRSRRICGWLVAMLVAAVLPAESAPQRVVSMNLCTDQIAMLLAAEGQLISVSDLAADPRMSSMADKAAAYQENHGRAEEIYLMRPDLVIAGQFTQGPTVQMLRRLGIRVEVFPPAESIESIRKEIRHMGALLGREQAADALLADFDEGLEATASKTRRGRAALYYANGFTSGRNTLAGTILDAAGYDNVAGDFGIDDTSALPMELIVMSQPDRVITGSKWPGQSRSEAILDHPALKKLSFGVAEATDRDWVCGTPYILRAIGELQ
ncbi:ABC transporter substrate-binding protein [Paracoccus onubensis]|uniref:ABC transporter substrate-binding protein n=1 Tax=Paracoccus onubensis TaxID=1675788 RepID=UPI00272F74D6|nr:ABC transporter substrate-binding protein [Paracoccus onubensis]MDP0925819.1 ABC transporter substrate-binding protein [Paracoccus onubensis]